jgi:ABC-type sugar transport system substrate-binding protein
MTRDDLQTYWRLAALLTAMAVGAAALSMAAASAQRDRHARAKKLGVSIIALSNPDRLMSRLRNAGGL